MKILSLDQSSQLTGYAVYEDTKLIEWGQIDLKKNKDLDTRFTQMCNEIDMLAKNHKVDTIVFEDVSLRMSIKTLIMLSRLQGAIINIATNNNATYHIYAPTQWRRILGFVQNNKIKRPELKKQAIEYVKQTYDLTVGDDIAEGLCIGLAYLKDINI